MFWDLTIFADDGETPILGTVDGSGNVTEASFSTDPAHPRPYLDQPKELGSSSIDFQEGRSTIATANLEILDKRRTANDQTTGILTYYLADANGISAVNGRRVLLERRDASTRSTAIAGVIGGGSLNDDWTSFTLRLRDETENARKIQAFPCASIFDGGGAPINGPTVLPRGVLAGYGKPRSDAPSSQWLLPPTAPLRAEYVTVSTSCLFKFEDLWITGNPNNPRGRVPAELVVSPKMEAVTRSVADPENPQRQIYRDVEILWRPTTGGSWTRLKNLDMTFDREASSILRTNPARYRDFTTKETEVSAVYALSGGYLSDGQTRPTSGQMVDVLLLYVGPPTKDYPFVFEGTHGELLRNGLRGDYSTLPPNVRYDEAAFLALDTPARLLQEEPVDDWREWSEKVLRALGGAAAVGTDGRIKPVVYKTPELTDVLFELTTANTVDAGWSHPDSHAINLVTLEYARDFRFPINLDIAGADWGELAPNGLGLGRFRVPIEVDRDQDVVATELLGERKWDLGFLPTLRSLGGWDGKPMSGDVHSEFGYLVSRERGQQGLDLYHFGGQELWASCLRSATASVALGQWVIVNLPWIPDYQTRVRGGQRIAIVIGIEETDDLTRKFKLLDGGAGVQAVAAPTFGTLTSSSSGVVSIPVATVPAGAEALIEFAVTDAAGSAPSSSSSSWLPLGRLDAAATLETPPQEAGRKVWVRGRSLKNGRRASAYTTPISITVASTPRVLSATVELSPSGVPTISWIVNAATLGVKVFYAVHDPATSPTLSTFVAAAASAGSVAPAVVVGPGQKISIEIEPWTGWTGSAVSGTAGTKEPAWALRPEVSIAPMRVETSQTATQATVLLTPVLGADFDLVEFRTRSGNAAWTSWATDAASPYTTSVSLNAKHPSAIAYRVSLGGIVVQEDVVEGFDLSKEALVVSATVTVNDSGVATVQIAGDVDTAAPDATGGRYSQDASTWTTFAVDGVRKGVFTVSQTGATEFYYVQLKNAAGTYGPTYTTITVPPYTLAPMRIGTSQTATVGTLGLTPLSGAVFDLVEFRSREGNGAWTGWTTDASAPYEHNVNLVGKHPSAIGYRVTRGGVLVQQGEVTIDSDDQAQVKGVVVSPKGDGTAEVIVTGDEDTATGTGKGRYTLGGGFTTFDISGTQRHGSFLINQSPVQQPCDIYLQNDAGSWGPVRTILIPAWDVIPPRVQVSTERSGSTLGLEVNVLDTRLRVTAIDFRSQTQGASYTGWASSWDISTGTFGVSAALVRGENFSLSDGADINIEWRVQYTDESGVTRNIGDTIDQANLIGLTKTLRFSFEKFKPATDATPWNYTASTLNSNSLSLQTYRLSPVLVKGTVVTKFSARLNRQTTSCVAQIQFTKVDDAFSTTSLGSITHSSTGWVVDQATLSETVGDNVYTATLTLDAVSDPAEAAIQWFEIEYFAPTFSKTY